MKRILLTGSSGFIGSHLRPLLKERKYEVFNLERYVTGRIGSTAPYPKDTYFADLTDVYALTKAVNDVRPNIVIHLGALTAVAYTYAHPQETLRTNFLGTVNLAEICTRIPEIEQFIFASSAEVYGVSKAEIKRERDRELISNSPYAVSKLAAEKYLIYLNKAFDFPITIFRPFNSYGRKKDTWFVVERAITQMLKGDKCYLGDPEPVRDLLYVDDHLNAYLHALENPKAIGEIFNISSGRGVSIRELAEKIKNLTEFKGEIIWNSLPKRALDIRVLIGDNKKIKRVLKVPEPISLEEGLKITIEYWRKKTRENGTC
jgi:nucleoside-diphosphate-sugar epimerase